MSIKILIVLQSHRKPVRPYTRAHHKGTRVSHGIDQPAVHVRPYNPPRSYATNMDTKEDEVTPGLLSATATGSVDIALHPLVILNASEHFIRRRAQEGDADMVGK